MNINEEDGFARPSLNLPTKAFVIEELQCAAFNLYQIDPTTEVEKRAVAIVKAAIEDAKSTIESLFEVRQL